MRLCSEAFFLLLCVPLCALPAAADTLRITSTPSGATVEINGVVTGVTPFTKDYPGGYFHRTRTSLGARLEHPMVARVSLTGYATKEIELTEGPMNWISLNGRHHGEYWLFKTDHFEVQLERVAESFTGSVSATLRSGVSATLQPALSLEQIVTQTKPAVVYLKGKDKAGTGFLLTDTGVIATNAHVARGEPSLLALFPAGQNLEAKIVYIDPELDIALLKVSGEGFPHLTLADTSLVRQGESVVAVGNPGDAMLFSVTKGVVSAIGKFPNAGPGTWIQTDAPINPGNSGGPLLNPQGEVIGISTMKLVKKGVSGIGFALSAGDLLSVLRRFYPNTVSVPETGAKSSTSPQNSAELPPAGAVAPAPHPAAPDSSAVPTPASPFASSPPGIGTVNISSDPDGAEIYIDGKFFGNTPATLKLPSGSHEIVLKGPRRAEWRRTLEILKGSKTTLNATLGPAR